MKCRWRSFLWLLLMVVVVLNVAIFFNMPGSREKRGRKQEQEGEGGGGGGDGDTSLRLDRHASHLQVLRKRLTANQNSSSLRRTESSNAEVKSNNELDPSDREDNRNYPRDDYSPQERAHGQNDDQAAEHTGSRKESRGGRKRPQEAEDEEENEDEGQGQGRQRSQQRGEGKISQQKGQGLGSRANYSIPEVDSFVKMFNVKYQGSVFSAAGPDSRYIDLLIKLTSMRPKGRRMRGYNNLKGRHSWEMFHRGIRQGELYDPLDDYVTKLLQDMATMPIVDVQQKDGGTQIKLMITFEDEGQALFKPMRFSRNQETLPDHFYFADYERHNAEIAAFHLDRILGFNRVPPTTGRMFNISSDLQKYADSKLAKTFFISPAGNLCFHGQCSYYCDSSHPICGHPVMLEGSLAALLPPLAMAKRKTWRNPWKRSYSKHRKAYWEVYNDLCPKVMSRRPYNEGRRLLDVLDISVFDFLTGNLDRHHYETFRDFGNETFPLHLDQGRAFGKASYDCVSCLAPVRQCCMIRLSTLSKLVKLYHGPKSLSELMRNSLSVDPVSPILTELHLDALDRRLSKILNVIDGCVKEGRPWDDVVVDDSVS